MSQTSTQTDSKSPITSDVTKKVAYSSRLRANPDEKFVTTYTSQLNNVLEYLNQLQAVDTGDISPLDIIQTITIDELRDDLPTISPEKYAKKRQNIINGFPKSQGNLLVLPVRIIE